MAADEPDAKNAVLAIWKWAGARRRCVPVGYTVRPVWRQVSAADMAV